MSCGGAYAPRQSAPSRRIGGAGDHRRDGATATLAKHALVAECDECFFDECSRKEKLLLHRILRPTSPPAPPCCSNDAWRCERPRRRRCRPVDALLPRGSFTSRSKLPVVYRGGLDASSSGIVSLPPAGTGPASFVGANRMPSSKVQYVCSSDRSRLAAKTKRLVEARVARRRAGRPQRREGHSTP